MATRKQSGKASRSIATIKAILVVLCSETIPRQNRLNTRFEVVGMVRDTRSDGLLENRHGNAQAEWRAYFLEIALHYLKRGQQLDFSLLSKFIIESRRIDEFEAAQPHIEKQNEFTRLLNWRNEIGK